MSERRSGIGSSLSDAEMRFIAEFQAQFIPFPIKDVLGSGAYSYFKTMVKGGARSQILLQILNIFMDIDSCYTGLQLLANL